MRLKILKSVTLDMNEYIPMGDPENTIVFLMAIRDLVNNTINHRGYIYLNQICEQLFIEWNPDDENPCIKKTNENQESFIEFDMTPISSTSIILSIVHYD